MLSIPIVAFAASMVSIDLIPISEDQIVSQVIESFDGVDLFDRNEAVGGVLVGGRVPDEHRNIFYSHPQMILFGFWFLIALYFISHYVSGVLYIRHLRKLSTSNKSGAFWLYRCVLVNTPFSFFRSIYVDNRLTGEKLDIVCRHESAHIESRHYVDKLLIELYIILSWFNPIVWRLRRELCAVHEFEADRVVLSGYDDMNRYRKFLFEEVDFSSPRVANGFNSSLIKQRFLEMKKSYQNQRSGLRKALSLLAVVALVAVTSLTYVVGQNADDVMVVGAGTVTVNGSLVYEAEKMAAVEKGLIIVKMKSGETKTLVGEEAFKVLQDGTISPEDIESISVLKDQAAAHYLANQKVDKHLDVVDPELAFEAEKKKNNHDYYNYYFLSPEQYQVVSYDPKSPSVVVYRRKDYTEVDYIYRMGWNWHWLHFSSNSYLVDPKSGDKYKIHSLKGDIPLDRTSVVRGMKGNYVVITAIYPPLKSDIKKVDYIEWNTPGARVPSNGSSGNEKGLVVNTSQEKSYSSPEKNKVITLDSDFKLE